MRLFLEEKEALRISWDKTNERKHITRLQLLISH